MLQKISAVFQTRIIGSFNHFFPGFSVFRKFPLGFFPPLYPLVGNGSEMANCFPLFGAVCAEVAVPKSFGLDCDGSTDGGLRRFLALPFDKKTSERHFCPKEGNFRFSENAFESSSGAYTVVTDNMPKSALLVEFRSEGKVRKFPTFSEAPACGRNGSKVLIDNHAPYIVAGGTWQVLLVYIFELCGHCP